MSEVVKRRFNAKKNTYQILNESTNRWVKESTRIGKKLLRDNNTAPIEGKTAGKYKQKSKKKTGTVVRRSYKTTSFMPSLENMVKSMIEKTDFTKQKPMGFIVMKLPAGGKTRAIPLEMKNNVKEMIDQILGLESEFGTSTVHGSDITLEIEANTVTNEFALSHVEIPAGGEFKGVNDKIKIHNYFKTIDYRSSNNDCLLMVCKRDLGLSQKCDTIRKELGLKRDQKIDISQIPMIEEKFKRNIDVYVDRCEAMNRIEIDEEGDSITLVEGRHKHIYYRENDRFRDTIDVLLKDEHYERITKFLFPKYDIMCGKELKKSGFNTKRDDYDYQEMTFEEALGVMKIRRRDKVKKLFQYDKEDMKPVNLFFDYETYYDLSEEQILKPYSISWYVDKISKSEDYEYDKKMLKKCYYATGKNCEEQFLRFLLQCPEGYYYRLVGYNSSRFDNFILAKYCSKNNELDNVLYANNSILQMTICRRHEVFDLCRFTMNSLKNSCESFKTVPQKIEGFDHDVPQLIYEKEGLKGLIEWSNSSKKLEKYNKIDVLATVSLYHKVRLAIKSMLNVDFSKYCTIGQLTYSTFKKSTEIEIPPPKNHEHDRFIRSAMVAGRTQAFKNKFKTRGKYVMVDVVSLYPYVMMERDYPVGEYKEVEKECPGMLGIYRCKIKKQPKLNIIPERVEGEALNWKSEKEIEGSICSIDIANIRKHGGEVEVYEGLVWEETSNTLFKDYFEPIKNEKKRQDVLKNNKDESYNPAFRSMCKLLLNSLSGKVVQRNFDSESKYLKGNNKTKEKSIVNKFIDEEAEIIDFGNSKIISGKLKEKFIYKKRRAKPSQLGIFIYAYAREHMYNNLLSRCDNIYMDTDSDLISYEDYQKLVHETPELFGKDFGQLEEEIIGNEGAENADIEVITICAKTYCVINHNDESKNKIKCKGINFNRDVVINIPKLMEEFKMDNEEELIELLSKDVFSMQKIYRRHEGQSPKNFFKELYENDKVYVACSQLAKNKATCVNGVEIPYNIRQVFMIKRITTKELEKIPIKV